MDSGVTTLAGVNTDTGSTAVNGGTPKAGTANRFSANSALVVNANGGVWKTVASGGEIISTTGASKLDPTLGRC